jgi:5-methylcytosine-specific restriction endonuclease McrA
MAVVDVAPSRGGVRTRKTMSSLRYCAVIKKLREWHEVHPPPPPDRSRQIAMDEARRLGTHTSAEWWAHVRSVKGICYYCGAKALFIEKDHKQPVTRGGSDGMDNLAVTCSLCNREKSTRTEREFWDHLAETNRVGIPRAQPGYRCTCGVGTLEEHLWNVRNAPLPHHYVGPLP